VIPATPSSFGDRNAAGRRLRLCLLAGSLAWPLACQALGLGKLTGEAVIGDGLQLEIPLTGTMDRPLGSECVAVQRSPDAIDPEYFPRDLVAGVDSQAGAPRIVLNSRAAIRQPLIEFRVFVSCGYNLFHDYVLMATPRNESAPAARPLPAAGLAPAALAAQTQAASPVVAAPVVAAGGRLPDGIAGRNIVLDRDTTLEQLSRQHFPGPLRQQRFMRWVVEANPQYFAGAAGKQRLQRLSSGTSLVIPATVPPRRPGDHQGNVTPLGERIEGSTEQAAAPTPPPRRQHAAAGGTTKAAAGSQDRLVVGGGGSNARNLKQAVTLIDQLTGMLEKQVAAQATQNDKIQQLETIAEDLGKQIKALEADAAKRESRWQAERQAEKVAREQEAERAWWNLLAATLAGGVVGGGLLFLLGRLFGRKQDADDEVIDLHPAVAELEPEPAVAPPVVVPAAKPIKAAPLTEFGWGDQPRQAPAAAAVPQHIEFEMPIKASPAAVEEPGDSANAAIELANIMTSMGLTESAAQTLVEHIRENPRESLAQWLKLLEIHRLSGNRSEFERSAAELKQHFNVAPDDWNAPPSAGRNSLEAYPHIRSQVVKLWRKPECVILLRALLLDNREGTRLGFPAAVAEEILLLIAIQNSGK
jgi:pilus assembly protein FimV